MNRPTDRDLAARVLEERDTWKLRALIAETRVAQSEPPGPVATTMLPPPPPPPPTPVEPLPEPDGLPVKTVHVRFNAWELTRLQKLARRECTTMQGLIRGALRKVLFEEYGRDG